MNIEKLFSNKILLNEEIQFFLTKKQIKKISTNKELIKAHIQKAKHNLEFYTLNKNQKKFKDWLIVILYYALYHCALALITNKKYASKNHYATILPLIKEYNISIKEAELLEELSINEEDAKLYTQLKDDRHNASYTTSLNFSNDKIKQYEKEIISFINKTEEIIRNS